MFVRWFTVVLVCLSLALPCPCDHGGASEDGAKDCCGNPLVEAFAEHGDAPPAAQALASTLQDDRLPDEAPAHDREGCPHCDEVRSVNVDTLDRLAAAASSLPDDRHTGPPHTAVLPVASWHQILTTTLRASRPPPSPQVAYVLPTPSRSLHLRLGVLLC